MNLRNHIKEAVVDGVANFQANNNGGQNHIGKVSASKDSVINFGVAEATTVDGKECVILVPEDDPTDIMVIDKDDILVVDEEVPVSKPVKMVKPTNIIDEFESDGKVNFTGA